MEEKEVGSYRFGPFELDTKHSRIYRDEQRYDELTPTEFEILSFLVQNAGKAQTVEDIITNVWRGRNVENSNVTTGIWSIRQRIEVNPKEPQYIKTIKVGYDSERRAVKFAYEFAEKALVKDSAASPDTKSLPLQLPPPVKFSKLDTIHVHVDGGSDKAKVADIVSGFGREDQPSKLNSVMSFAKGPQRDDDPDSYDVHTPGGKDNEKLEYFSTHILGNFAETKRDIHRLLYMLHQDTSNDGMVVEAERVIGLFSDDYQGWSDTYINHYPVLRSGDVGYKVCETKPIEVHFGLDIPKQGRWATEPPLDMKELPALTAEWGIRVGGWFLFDKFEANKWAYRSNMFVPDAQPGDIERQRLALKRRVEELGAGLGFECEVKALVEHTIGIWNTPLEEFKGPRSVNELAEWEEHYPKLRDFWVVTPNFLGDKEHRIQEAMLRNLHKNVTYTYFLRSFADYNRLRFFAEGLQREMGGRVDVFKKIHAVLILREASDSEALDKIFVPGDKEGGEQGYFIANPIPRPGESGDADGYVLEGTPGQDRISGGRVMQLEQIEEIVDLLRPLLANGRPLQGFGMPLGRQENKKLPATTVVCVGLKVDAKNLSEFMMDVEDDATAALLREYDLLVAGETSKEGGKVVRSIEQGYLLIFDKQYAAIRCAKQLRKGVMHLQQIFSLPLSQRVSIDYGTVWLVMRAHGIDYCGKPVTRCRELLKKTRFGVVAATEWYANSLWHKHRAELIQTEEEFHLDCTSNVWKLRREDAGP